MASDAERKQLRRLLGVGANTNARWQERFQVTRVLGEGAYGRVVEAHDRLSHERVALKLLSRIDGRAIARFKQEMRAMDGLAHPNLVRLNELIHSDGEWLLSMELLEGTDFLSFVRGQDCAAQPVPGVTGGEVPVSAPPPGECNETLLRPALAQLAEGLHALHCAGLVHRDVKPGNIRVTPAGRVVVLDFGLVLDTELACDSTQAEAVGTAAYMAPEQATGDPASTAVDWYAMGVLLFEALTGVLPYEGTSLQVLMAKQTGEIPRPRDVRADVPRDLDALCAALMERDPARRPGGESILHALTNERSTPSRAPGSQHASRTAVSAFVGRADELQQLRLTVGTGPRRGLAVRVLRGESGIGKTRLAQEFLAEVARDQEDALILRSRCVENETVPYKALDGGVDELARALSKLETSQCEALLPEHAGFLPLVFPVLNRVPAIVALGASDRSMQDRVAMRTRVFGALRELLHALARDRPVVLFIDDLQWADVESLALLAELMRRPEPPPILLLASCVGSDRMEEGLRDRWERLVEDVEDYDEVSLERLVPEASEKLARHLLEGASEDAVSDVVREGQGHPMFLEALAAHRLLGAPQSELTFEGVVSSWVHRQPEGTRRLLELCCTAAAPTGWEVLREASGLDSSAFQAAMASLRVARMVSVERRERLRLVEPFHKRIRLAVLRDVPEHALREYHLQIAAVLERSRVALERQAHHFMEAGRPKRAASAAAMAGDQAMETLAFDRAARMYALALKLQPEGPNAQSLSMRYADALAEAGRCGEAADVFLQVAEGMPVGESLELRRRAVQQLLQAGRTDEGLHEARRLLESLGMPPLPDSRRASIAALTWESLRRACSPRGFKMRPADTISQDELVRVDLLWGLASCLGPVDPLLSAVLQSRHFRLAQRAGDPGRAAQALALDAIGLLFRGKLEHAARSLERAREVGENLGRPDIDGHFAFVEGFYNGALGDEGRTIEPLERSIALLCEESSGTGWLLTAARSRLLVAFWVTGAWSKLREEYPKVLRDAEERGAGFTRSYIVPATGFAYHLMHDDPTRARQTTEGVMDGGYATIRAQLGLAHTAIYEDPRKVEAVRDALNTRDPRADLGNLSAERTLVQCLLNAYLARQAGGDRRSELAVARRQLVELQRHPIRRTAMERISSLMRAVIADAEGDHEQALIYYAQAAAAAKSTAHPLYVQLATVRQGQLLGSEGASLIASVEEEMGAQGVKRPLRLLHSMLPGVLDPELLS